MIEWIITSSALILLVLLLRAVIKDRVSPRLRYALWALVLVRLLAPVSLWESPASVLNAARANSGYQLASTLPNDMQVYENGNLRSLAGPKDTFRLGPEGSRVWKEEQPALYNAYGWAAVSDAEKAQSLREQGEKAVDNITLKRMVDVKRALNILRQAGSGLVLLFLAVVNGRFALVLRKKRRPAGTYRGRDVYAVDGLATPCLFGLFRPGIYLTPGLSEDEKTHVLAHEYTHFRQRDHIWAILRGVCLALHWYNPLVWLAAVLSRRDCELSCDEGAVRLLGEEHRADYGRTLVGLVARRTTAADLACCATTMTGGKSALKERITLLVKRPRTTAVMAALITAACVVFALCTFTGAAEAEEPDAPAEPVQAEQEPADAPAPEEEPVSLPEDIVLLDMPEDLPTELMDLSRPAEEQGEWLLLAQAPYTDASLYRRADDDQHVYLRLTNQCFQRFDRDLTGMELLPTMDLWDGEAELAMQVLYRRYEGTYFNGKTYEPGIVAEMVLYDWNVDGKYWEEKHISTQPMLRLTEDLPAIADLPRIFGITGNNWDAPMWWVGNLREDDIDLYYAQYEETMYLRYGDHIQKIAEKMESEWLPELYFEDLDGDGSRELLVHYHTDHGTGVHTDFIAVYEWDGEKWYGTTHRPDNVIRDFNNHRTYEFYDDGTAFIRYGDADILLDLSDLWEDYWSAAPDICVLDQFQTYYTYQDGQITLIISGELLSEDSVYLHGYAFEYVCPVIYSDYGDGAGYLNSGEGVLRSEFAAERPDVDKSRLTPTFRRILREFIEECRQISAGVSNNFFSVCDVNGDGKDELITLQSNTSLIGQTERVYDADGNELLAAYPLLTYYDNGYATAEWSHNQGVAGDKLWPYDLYKYDVGAGKYVRIATVDGWDKSIRDTHLSYDETVISFPDDVDRDGDGFVYYIIEEAGGYAPVYGRPMDYADYALWAASYLSGNVVPVHYAPLTEENIALIQ